ncbi:MAG: enoyl-CoA hydratase, partial [Stackebrandtia sp.]
SRLGLLTELADTDDDVHPRASQLAAGLAAGPPAGYAEIKRLLRRDGDFADALEAESAAQSACGRTADHRNAVDAFVNKRKPEFEGR